MRLLLPPFLLTLASCMALESGPQDAPVRFLDENLSETSGLAVSRRDPAHLWLINDSGSAAAIHLAGTDGAALGIIKLTGVKNTDWEDLSTFTLEGKPYLLVADAGDNQARRKEVVLHVIAEPKTASSDLPIDLRIRPDWSIRFRFEDGPRDCEAVAVDSTSRSILLISKRETRPAIYQLPLQKPSKRGIITAKRLGPLAKLRLPPKAMPHPFAFQPTGLDISADGRLAALLTYRGAYLFRRGKGESWAQAFAKEPEILGAHGLTQAEALAFSADGKMLFVTSEGKRPRLVSIPIPDPVAAE